MSLSKLVVNFNQIETVKAALEWDEVTFFANQLFTLSVSIEEYAVTIKNLAKTFVPDKGNSDPNFILISGRIEDEIVSSITEKTHPIHVITMYMVSLIRKASENLMIPKVNMNTLEMRSYSPAECISCTEIFEVYVGHLQLYIENNSVDALQKLTGTPPLVAQILNRVWNVERNLFLSRFNEDFYKRNPKLNHDITAQIWCQRNPILDFQSKWGTGSDHFEYVSEFNIGPFIHVKEGYFRLVREPRAIAMKPVFIPLLCKQHDRHIALAAPYLHTRVATEKLWRGIQKSVNDIPQKKLRQADVLCSLGTFFPNSTMEMHSTYRSMHTVCGFMQFPSRRDTRNPLRMVLLQASHLQLNKFPRKLLEPSH